jgi:hypothetical protein
MVSKNVLKVIGIVSILIMVLNLVLFILGKINGLVFWGVIVAGAVFAFIALPKMKK